MRRPTLEDRRTPQARDAYAVFHLAFGAVEDEHLRGSKVSKKGRAVQCRLPVQILPIDNGLELRHAQKRVQQEGVTIDRCHHHHGGVELAWNIGRKFGNSVSKGRKGVVCVRGGGRGQGNTKGKGKAPPNRITNVQADAMEMQVAQDERLAMLRWNENHVRLATAQATQVSQPWRTVRVGPARAPGAGGMIYTYVGGKEADKRREKTQLLDVGEQARHLAGVLCPRIADEILHVVFELLVTDAVVSHRGGALGRATSFKGTAGVQIQQGYGL